VTSFLYFLILKESEIKELFMRRFIIDTDTASDDAVALILALREPSISVEAITVVAGNVPLDLAVKNALVSVEMADTYQPPVFAGMASPLLRPLFTSEFVHGEDGMGNMNLPEPIVKAESEHAVDALIRLVSENPDELELITLGPLTNVAMACLKAPDVMRRLMAMTIMGGAGLGSGNITPVAEFNVFVDAEAVSIVLNSAVPIFIVGWDVSMGTTFINEEDIRLLNESGSRIARFCVRCNRALQEFNLKRLDKHGFDLPDPATVAAVLYPELVHSSYEAFVDVEYKSEKTYGQLIIDPMHLLEKKPNARICETMDGEGFKRRLFDAII
jgi:purine nucleosidase